MNLQSRRDGMRTGVGLMKLGLTEGKLSHDVIAMGVQGLDPEALMALISWAVQTMAVAFSAEHGKEGAMAVAEEMLRTIDHYYEVATQREADS